MQTTRSPQNAVEGYRSRRVLKRYRESATEGAVSWSATESQLCKTTERLRRARAIGRR
jgi:hypothetical protein